MAVGGIVSVTPVGPGQYKTDFANGKSMLLTGQPGEEAYARHQAASALGPNAVAGPGAGADPAESPSLTSRLGAHLGRALPVANALVNPASALAGAVTGAAAKATGPKPERVGKTTVEEPTAQPEPGKAPEPAAAAPAEEAPPTKPTSLGYTMKGLDPASGKEIQGEAFRMPDGSVQIYRAPTAGSPGGLTALGKQTMSQYAEAQSLAAQHSAKASEYQQIGVDLAVQDAEAHQAFIQKQQELNLLEQHRQQDEERELQQKVEVLNGKYELARQTFADARVDPNRAVKKSAGGGWLLGLAGALGAMGAALARTPNFAMDYINNRIADDIRSQEAAINVKGRDADNQLATLTRSLGDLGLAKKAFRQLKLEEASLEGARISNQFKGQQVAANALTVSEQAMAEGIKAGEEKSRAFTEHVLKDKIYFKQGSAGSRGGFAVPTQESYQSARGSNIDVEKLKLQQNKADAQAGKGPHLGQRAQGTIVAARNARTAIHEAATALDLERDEKGEFQDPSWGTAAASKLPYSDTRQKMNALRLTMIAEVGKAQTGGALTEAEAHEMKGQIDAANTPGEIGALLRHYDHTMASVEKNVRSVAASSSPGADEEREDDGR